MPPVYNPLYIMFYCKFGSLTYIRDFYQMLLQLGAVTPKKHIVKFIDERFEKVNFNEDYDLVAIASPTDYTTRAYEIADEFRNRGKKVVLCDYHPTILAEEAKQHADSVLVGEGELTWPKLLEDFQNENLKPFYKQETPVDPKLIPPARRDLVKKYHRLIVRLQATRGCPIGCEFCRVPSFEGKKLRKRPVENVIKEIKSIRQKLLFFGDGSLTIDPEYTKSLFREMKGLRKKFFCCGNPDVLAEDDELLKAAKAAGCIIWYVGLESVNQETIDLLGKKTNVVEKYDLMVKKIHKYGMAVSGSFIHGFDNDTFEDLDKTLAKIYDLKLDHVEFNLLTPYPGTPLYERLEKEGRILTKDWYNYREGQSGTEIVFRPKNITREDLFREGRARLLHKWYGGPGMNKKEFRIKKMKLIKEGLNLGFYPFIYRTFGYLFHL